MLPMEVCGSEYALLVMISFLFLKKSYHVAPPAPLPPMVDKEGGEEMAQKDLVRCLYEGSPKKQNQ